LKEDVYDRELRLADLSKRLVECYFQKVNGVFIDAPWDCQTDLLSAQIDPNEDFIVFRTIADVLGTAVPVSRINIGGEVQGLLFDRNGQAIMFVWDEYAPPKGRDHILYLGENAEQVDLWGRRNQLKTIESKKLVHIGPMPTFIINAPTWIMEFHRNFILDPPLFKSSYNLQRPQISFRNTYHRTISGTLRLVPPTNWDISVKRISFMLQPDEEFRQDIMLRFPQNAEAGIKGLVGEFTIDADRRYHILATAWFELGIENIDMETYVLPLGDDVIIRQLMTNRTDQPISFDV